MQPSSPATLSNRLTRVPLPEALRRDILAMVRALPDHELLALVGDRLADLVARHAALALSAREATRPARSSPAKPRARQAGVPCPEPEPPAEQEGVSRGRHAPMLPWPRAAEDGTPLGLDLAAPGLTARTKTIADDVRRLVLSRWVGNAARLLDPDDLVQEVHRRIIRRNRRPCAFDPRQGSIGHYVYQVTGGAIADMLKPAKRRADHELLTLDSCDLPEPTAPEPDAPLDLDSTPSEPDAREDFFLALCCLEVLGELPVKEPLWQRALRQREKEQARARAAAKRGREREERRTAKRAATRAATKATREQKRAALDAEVLAFIQSETAQGRPVRCSELAAMLGLNAETIRVMLERLAKGGAVEVRRLRGSRPATYWALPEQVGTVDAAPLLHVETEPAPELPSEALPEADATTAIPLGPELTEEPAQVALDPLPSAAEEPPAPPPSLSALPAPASWPHRRLNSKRLHVSFPAVDIAMFAPPSPESLRAGR